MFILGVDPGKTGGWAITNESLIVAHGRMPLMPYGKKKQVVAGATLLGSIISAQTIGEFQIDFAVHELVFNGKHEGGSSSFSFGMNVAASLMAANLACPHVNLVSPIVWKKPFELGGGKPSKLKALELCEKLFRFRGTAPVKWDVQANDGIAEAALMARWMSLTITAEREANKPPPEILAEQARRKNGGILKP